MANYNVGNIEIGIKTNSKNTVSEIDKIINKLQDFNKIDKNLQNIFLRINQLSNGLRKLSKLDVSSVNAKIQGVVKSTEILSQKLSSITISPQANDTVTSLNRIGNAFRQFNNFKDFDLRKMYQSVSSINRILTPFLEKINASEKGLSSFAFILKNLKVNNISKLNNGLQQVNKHLDETEKKGKNLKKVFNLGRIYFLINYTKRLARALANTVTSAINFNETLNKFQVAMGENYEKSLKFVDSLTHAFNLSTESIMNYQSTFKNMLSALGSLSEDTSYQLSETLTRMAIDYASLFNVQVDRAMNQFQQVLSGQIRQIRTVAGYDVSESTIFSIYKELGGQKTMRQLDQVEKRLLRIIALQRQMEQSGAVGDFSKTINTAANQLKQLQETIKEISRWIGQLTMQYMQPLIEKVLAGAIAIKEMLKALNIARGYEYEDFGEGGLFGEVEESADAANESVQALNKSLLGFDKLNVLGKTETKAGLPDYAMLTEQIKKYQSSLDKVKNRANEIAENILVWLGYTKSVDSETGNINWELGEGYTRIQMIVDLIKGFIDLGIGVLITKSIIGIGTKLDAIKGIIGIINPKIAIIATIVTIIALAFKDLYDNSESFRESIHNIGENLKSTFDTLQPLFEVAFESLKTSLETVIKLFEPIIEFITRIFEGWTQILKLDFKGALETFINAWKDLFKNIGDIFVGIYEKSSQLWTDITNAFKKVFEPIVDWVKEKIIDPIKNRFTDLWENLKLGFVATITTIKEKLFGFIDKLNLQPLIDNFKNTFGTIKDTIVDVLTNALNFIKKSFTQPVSKTFSDMWSGIKNDFKAVINFFIRGINILIKGLNKISFKVPDWIPKYGGNVWGINIPKIPELANGGVIRKPTMAMVGEYAGANTNPEIVTPEKKMKQVFAETMLPLVQAIVSGDKDVINAIGDLANRPITLNGRKVSENIYDDLSNVAYRKGKTLVLK